MSLKELNNNNIHHREACAKIKRKTQQIIVENRVEHDKIPKRKLPN